MNYSRDRDDDGGYCQAFIVNLQSLPSLPNTAWFGWMMFSVGVILLGTVFFRLLLFLYFGGFSWKNVVGLGALLVAALWLIGHGFRKTL